MNKINTKVLTFKEDFLKSWMLTEWLRFQFINTLQNEDKKDSQDLEIHTNIVKVPNIDQE